LGKIWLMWPGKKKIRRRLETRRTNSAQQGSFWQRFFRAGAAESLILSAVLFAGLLAIDLWPTDPIPWRTGQYIPADIYARVGFEVPSVRLRNEQIEQARTATQATFKLNSEMLDEISKGLLALPDQFLPLAQGDKGETPPAPTDPAAAQAWQSYADPQGRQRYAEQVQKLCTALMTVGIVRQEDKAAQRSRAAAQVWLEYPSGKVSRNIRYEIVGLGETELLKREVAEMVKVFDPPAHPEIQKYLLGLFDAGKSLYRYDLAATQRDIEERQRAIQANPPTEVFQAGQCLVRSSRRVGTEGRSKVSALSAGELELLINEHKAYRLAQPRWFTPTNLTGRAIVLLLLTILLSLHISKHQSQAYRRLWRGLAAVVLMLAMLLTAKMMVFWGQWNPYASVLPVVMLAVVLAISYDQLFALAVGSIFSVLVVFQLSADLQMLIVLLSALTAGVAHLKEVRTRSRLLEISALAAGGTFFSVVAVGLARLVPWQFILSDGAWGAGFAVLVGFLVLGVLPGIERVFGVVTSMTLLEWCDASKPLLKRLAMEAPGTYSHSLQLGTLCEAAAESIEARGLLARVGAYYHDIGKINKPDYFVENQAGMPSKHSKLSPALSLLVIIGHVKDGLEMAWEYGLPRVLHEFMATHHGTTLLQYFYQAAIESRKNGTDRMPDEVEFRYPGPKPRSKEAAILMLADAAESSVRSMSQPTAGRVENQVHTMISRRLLDGQLDECDLTLNEVHLVETSLIKSLMGIYHARIAYPRMEGQKPSAAELSAERQSAQTSQGSDDSKANGLKSDRQDG